MGGPEMLTRQELLAIMPGAAEVAARYLKPLNDAMVQYSINTPARQAAFLAQLAHESAELTFVEENLDYSWERLRKVFPRYFSNDISAQSYDHEAERIGNRIYANRLGNGDEASGDGYRYRGRGPMQVTGRENYRRCGQAIAINLEADPDRLAEPEIGCRAAAWYWHNRGLNTLADANDEAAFREITRRINGAFLGLEARITFWRRASETLRANADMAMGWAKAVRPTGRSRDAQPVEAEVVAAPAAAKPARPRRAAAKPRATARKSRPRATARKSRPRAKPRAAAAANRAKRKRAARTKAPTRKARKKVSGSSRGSKARPARRRR
jgi:putative chitinase